MPTTVTHSIGSAGGRDYSTLAAWAAACPADLTVVDEIWRGEAYNDSQFATTCDLHAVTTDATRYPILTAASGQSFQDNASVRTTALRFNSSNGVSVSVAFDPTGHAVIRMPSFGQVTRFQVERTSIYYGTVELNNGGLVKDCICHNGEVRVGGSLTQAKAINVLWYADVGTDPAFRISDLSGVGHLVDACTAVRVSNHSPSGSGIICTYANGPTVNSSAFFNFSAIISGASAGGDFNATDLGSGFGGTHDQYSVTFSAVTPFVGADSTGTLDFRAVAATALAANGLLDATNAPNDISGFTRPANPTIGVWQLASAAVTTGRSYFV